MDGGMGMSTREAAEVLGVSHETVAADTKRARNLTSVALAVSVTLAVILARLFSRLQLGQLPSTPCETAVVEEQLST
jgi:hypothetical protein